MRTEIEQQRLERKALKQAEVEKKIWKLVPVTVTHICNASTRRKKRQEDYSKFDINWATEPDPTSLEALIKNRVPGLGI